MSLVTVHGPNTMYTDAPGVLKDSTGTAQATQDANNGLKFTFALITESPRANQDFSWAFPPDGTPSPQTVESPTQVTYASPGAKTATLTVTNAARTVSNKVLNANVATLTSNGHGFLAGQTVVVAGVDATFNGTYVITAVTANTFSYDKVAANVGTTAATGTATPSGMSPAAGPYTIAVTAVSGMPKSAEGDQQQQQSQQVAIEPLPPEQQPDDDGIFDPADFTIPEVMEWAQDNPGEIDGLIAAEQAGKNRSTLLTQLQALKG